jgi:hypothetical protein
VTKGLTNKTSVPKSSARVLVEEYFHSGIEIKVRIVHTPDISSDIRQVNKVFIFNRDQQFFDLRYL